MARTIWGSFNERPLGPLRHDLARPGLAREAGRGETEHRMADVLEVMRYLIAGDDMAVCSLAQQHPFVRARVQPWEERLCDGLELHPRTDVYQPCHGAHTGCCTGRDRGL